MITAALDHLCQSTLFVGVAGLLTLMLRRNTARVRHAIWLAASVKFLVPLAILVAIGTRLAPSRPVIGPGSPTRFLGHLGTALVAPARFASLGSLGPPVVRQGSLETILITIWAFGLVTVAAVWLSRWLRIRELCREARLLEFATPVPVKCCKSPIEPALVGIFHPVILLPEGLTERLSPQELEAVLAHEVSHFRRRDNLTAAIHMIVETVFWFFPITWWLGSRLIAERERACDETVLSGSTEAEFYAETILKVCKFYIRPPIACVTGVSGADLRRRVEVIMKGPQTRRVTWFGKVIIAVVAVLTLALPLGVGVVRGKAMAADGSAVTSAAPTPAQIAEQLYLQARPHMVIPFNSSAFDKYVGYYELGSVTFMHVTRNGDHYFVQISEAQGAAEIYPDSPSEFFMKVAPAQISFISNSAGQTTGLVLHAHGLEQQISKVNDSVAREAEAQVTARIAANAASPGTEAALRHQIDDWEKGAADYSVMTSDMAEAARNQASVVRSVFKQVGSLQALVFKGVGADRMDVFEAIFANGQVEFRIYPLTHDGKIAGLVYRVLP